MKINVYKRASEEISSHVKDWKTIKITLPVPPCEPKHNRQCMYNAMNEFKAKRAVAIIEVVSSDNDPILHYLCMDKNGDIYDPTLGWSWSGYEWKLIQYIHPETDHNMGKHLQMAKEKLVKEACSKVTKRMINLFKINLDKVV